MRFLICLLVAVVLKSTPLTAKRCPVVPLFRLYNPTTFDHFYTTSEEEANNAATNLGYVREGSPGLVSRTACSSSFKPVFRLYKPDDHFYTNSEEEAINATSSGGWVREGIAFYCPSDIHCGASLPLNRYWRGTEHFYTTEKNEGTKNVVDVGGVYEGITCYIWAPK